MRKPINVLHAIEQADIALGVAGLRGETICRVELRAARAAVAKMIGALEAIRDFRGELNAPVANSVKLRGIARAALANIRSAP